VVNIPSFYFIRVKLLYPQVLIWYPILSSRFHMYRSDYENCPYEVTSFNFVFGPYIKCLRTVMYKLNLNSLGPKMIFSTYRETVFNAYSTVIGR